MERKIRLLGILGGMVTLVACSTYQKGTYLSSHQVEGYTNLPYYSHMDVINADYNFQGEPSRAVNVPDSYYVGAYHSPASHKDIDRDWVKQQNPQGYTIEVADSEKASQVASKLYKMPKTERKAEIKYSRDGQTYYKGVYGSYNSYEEAQKALNNLPEDIRREVDIKNWHKVQE